jgi:hypothetical protein
MLFLNKWFQLFLYMRLLWLQRKSLVYDTARWKRKSELKIAAPTENTWNSWCKPLSRGLYKDIPNANTMLSGSDFPMVILQTMFNVNESRKSKMATAKTDYTYNSACRHSDSEHWTEIQSWSGIHYYYPTFGKEPSNWLMATWLASR